MEQYQSRKYFRCKNSPLADVLHATLCPRAEEGGALLRPGVHPAAQLRRGRPQTRRPRTEGVNHPRHVHAGPDQRLDGRSKGWTTGFTICLLIWVGLILIWIAQPSCCGIMQRCGGSLQATKSKSTKPSDHRHMVHPALLPNHSHYRLYR